MRKTILTICAMVCTFAMCLPSVANATTVTDEQVAEMNTVYYIAANKKSLKENGILTSKYILRENVPTEMFTKSDKRDLNEITIEAKKVVVLSSHPMSSYTINKTETTNVLQITNTEQFWSVTKYLVISTK